MNHYIKIFPTGKIFLVLAVSLLLTVLLNGYHFFTFQKSYFILIYGIFFCFFLYYEQWMLHHPDFSFRPFIKKRLLVHAGIVMLLFVLLFFLFSHHAHGKSSTVNLAGKNIQPAGYINYYKLITLSASYQEFGLVKRGLVPTIVNFFSSEYNKQFYLAKFIGAVVFFSGLFCFLVSRQEDLFSKKIFLAAFLLAPVGIFYQLNFTAGVYDMTMIGIFFFSTAFNRKPVSVFLDITGLMVHEAYIFLRLPFILFNLYEVYTGDIKNKTKGYVLNGLHLMAVSLFFLLMISEKVRPEMSLLKNNYFRHFPQLPPPDPRDFHALDPLSRNANFKYDLNLIEQYYHSKEFHTYPVPLVLGILVVAAAGYFFNNLSGKERRTDMLCSLGVFMFPLLLSFVGADIGRWMNLSFISWLVYYLLFRPRLIPRAAYSDKCLFAILFSFLTLSPLGVFEHPLMSVLLH